MSEHPPIPGVDLGEDEQIIDHGTLLGYEWWLTTCREDDGTLRFIADILLPARHPVARAYKAYDTRAASTGY